MDQLQTRPISPADLKILHCHQGMTQLTPLFKKFACNPSIKAIKKKFKIKSAFSFNLVSTETIKIIINDRDIKKASSGEIPTYLFKKCDFILDTVTVSVNEALKTGS